ncbi:MAG: cation:proton antiporter [Melioribacteraceae bacterium]|nr:cation:proton antiporter [Melioribacteraceae bacterium]MCF8354927.1 cation:proton antiporter [Melioribacteraceae bacterium]MCF8392384.1 cation:proton antiporter [Melioribacteraceae bacterium]MCF8417905.1 cation:proton antiporter [Melioribacteraceae bacterium]
MGGLSSADTIRLLLAITLMLGFGRLLGELFRKFKQAAVVGEIIAGIILGPTILGLLFPELQQWIFPVEGPVSIAINSLVALSIIFLLLVVGLEVDLGIVLQQGKAALSIGLIGMIVPFIFGASFAYLLPDVLFFEMGDKLIFSLFVGTALAISALPIIARTLMDLNLFKSKTGMTIMAAAMFNDLVGWIAFSVILGLVGAESHGLSIEWTISLTIIFTIFMLFFGRKLIHQILPWINSTFSWPGGIISFMMVLALIGAIITEKIGVHSIFGAFIIGVAIGDSVHLTEKTKEIIHQFITNIFAPLFFVSIGLKVNFIQAFDPLAVIIVVVLGFAGKVIGCGLGAKLMGFKLKDSLAVGFAMNARGVLEIVLGIIALEFGLIGEEFFVAIIILVLLSSVLSSPLVSYFAKESRSYSILELLLPKNIYFSSAETKDQVIRELVKLVCKKEQIDEPKLLEAVLKREEQMTTGIANHLAIPHAKFDVAKPVCAVAINKNGVDFDAPDKLPAKIIFLLITPTDKNELQLQLLSEIAVKFRNKEFAEDLLNVSKPDEFLMKIKQLNS